MEIYSSYTQKFNAKQYLNFNVNFLKLDSIPLWKNFLLANIYKKAKNLYQFQPINMCPPLENSLFLYVKSKNFIHQHI